METELRRREIVGLDDARRGFTTLQGTHGVGHLPVLIAQHGPTVDPATRHDGEHTAHTTAVLEDDAVPIAILCVDDGTLSLVAEATKLALENDLLFPRTMDVVGTIAHLTTVLAGGVDVGDHEQIILAVVLDDARAL